MEIEEINALRSAIRRYPEVANEMTIKGQHLATYKYVQERRRVSSSALSKHLDVSTPHASNLLKVLEKRHFIKSHLEPQPSGGFEKIYEPID